MTKDQQRREQAAWRAKQSLAHFMRAVFKAAGLPWDSDSQDGITGIVDDLVEACTPVPPPRPLSQLTAALDDLEQPGAIAELTMAEIAEVAESNWATSPTPPHAGKEPPGDTED
ncbi:MAG: hypothetical protein JRD89_03540 [Deltaproteobacteria bacterium]|nr:hypothetical protein [Deltaproteobacteria bacterium]